MTSVGMLPPFSLQRTDSSGRPNLRTALQPTFGKLYKVFNVKWVFLIAVTVFESISVLLIFLNVQSAH